MKIQNKKGNSILIIPILTFFSIVIILLVGIFCFNMIRPFIWYEKLNNIANKYMFIIERYGYLTQNEKINLENDLKNSGFELKDINLVYPINKHNYGEIIKFEINYNIKINLFNYKNNIIQKDNKIINLKVKKYCYSKI